MTLKQPPGSPPALGIPGCVFLAAMKHQRLYPWVVCWLITAAPAAADVFVLSTGGQIEGTLVNTPDSPRDRYVIQTALGGQVTLNKDQVKQIVHKKPAEVEYEKIRHQYPDTVDGQWALAEWCREHHLSDLRKTHLKRIIQLDPDHVAARGLLGYGKFDGEWKTQQEVMTDRGYVEYKGAVACRKRSRSSNKNGKTRSQRRPGSRT